jgi:hypothetical protein
LENKINVREEISEDYKEQINVEEVSVVLARP